MKINRFRILLGIAVSGGMLISCSGQANSLSAPETPCWKGGPERDSFQGLLGTGEELLQPPDGKAPLSLSGVSHCEYEAKGDDGLESVLRLSVNSDDELPKSGDMPVLGIGGSRPPSRFEGGLLSYFARSEQRMYFACEVSPGETRVIKVGLSAVPMASADRSAMESRKIGLDMLIQAARGVSERAKCRNDTQIPARAPAVKDPNWAGFDG